METYDEIEAKLRKWKAKREKVDELLSDLRYDQEPDLPAGVDEGTLTADLMKFENYIAENQAKLDALTAHYGCMTTELYNMAPSDQVVSNGQKRKYCADAFHRNVETVDTVVQDACILHSFLIARGVKEYGHDQRLDVPAMSAQLQCVSSGNYYQMAEADGNLTKMARLSEMARNSVDNMESEDVRSSNFAAQWNAMVYSLTGVLAMPQVVTRKPADSKRSINKTDVVLAKVSIHEASPKDNRVVDFSIVFEWKTSIKDGMDREGAIYALHLHNAIARKKFLIFTVAPGQVQVYGIYWVTDKFLAQRVRLAEYTTLEACLKEWLPAMLWFVNCANDTGAPEVPLLSIEAKSSVRLQGRNTYKIDLPSGPIVWKVYDYVNRLDIPVDDRRWMNFTLVQRFYPSGVKQIASTSGLDIFSCPFFEGGKNLHIPKSKNQFLLVGQQLKSLHEEHLVFGDIRLGNMLFLDDGTAHLIDFDFCRKLNKAKPPRYIEGYGVDRLPRHPDAQEKQIMLQEHDVYSFWLCWLALCGQDIRNRPCPHTTMAELLKHIEACADMSISEGSTSIAELGI